MFSQKFRLFTNFWALCLLSLVFASHAFAEEEVAAPESQYVELAPSFVANYGSGTSKLKYIKADITLRVPSKEAEAIIESNLPLVRHEIVMVLSRQSQADMDAPDSQNNIRLAILEALKVAMQEETGSEQVTDLLFYSFVIQG